MDTTKQEKTKARWLFKYAVKVGRIVRQPCEKCGAQNADGHHDDYSKPMEVRWLCRRHHTIHHNVERGWVPPSPNWGRTHCLRGHPFSGDNLRVDPKTGHRRCFECYRIRRRNRLEKAKP